jgi:methylmalonyl-CoA mutase N-terminal domain/subunit
MEESARDYIRRIDEMGGMIAAIEKNFPQREIANASYEYQTAIERGDKVIVGVNAFQANQEEPIEILQIDQNAQNYQAKKLAALRARRDNGRVGASLDALRRTAEGTENTMPFILDAVRAYATLGEICDALREVFGSYQETSLV